MASPPENSSNWAFDYGLLEDLPPLDPCFQWANPKLLLSVEMGISSKCEGIWIDTLVFMHVEFEDSYESPDCMKKHGSRKRFQELSSLLEPGRPPKMDKSVILSDAVRMVIQLREEAQKLKESYDNLQGKVNELKKDKLEQQVKDLSTRPGIFHHLPPIPSHFAAPPQVVGSKLVPVMGFSGIPMWQLMPRTAVDTSEDHTLRPPVA
ncbi:hypothetical protein DH2020_032974 [Rehmannia glutinosa]|uniref:Uncharacterized protein n=1 Tax=Rehmannia glutinosa TaxID=99300 RepID=A0ABR0VDX8_REHGL